MKALIVILYFTILYVICISYLVGISVLLLALHEVGSINSTFLTLGLILNAICVFYATKVIAERIYKKTNSLWYQED